MNFSQFVEGSPGPAVRLSPAAGRGVPMFLILVTLCLAPALGADCQLGSDGKWSCQTPANPAVVRVSNSLSGSHCYGSGTLIEGSRVLTASHIFREGKGAIVVGFANGERRPATFIEEDTVWDLAVLSIENPPVAPIRVAEADPEPGEATQACGWGRKCEYRAAGGRAIGYIKTTSQELSQNLVVSGGAREGDSGGPILNADGQLVAVIWGTDGQRTMGACCLRVRRFLRGFCLPPCPPRPPPVPLPPAPTLPVPLPPAPVPPVPDDPCGDLRILVAANAQAIAALAEAAKIPGPPGPQGPPGEVDLGALVERVLAKLPPVRLQTVRPDGSVITEATAPLGSPLKLRLVPVAKDK